MIRTEVSALEDISNNELFEENGVFQFVIPSIQRDYQWGLGSDSGATGNDSAFAFMEDLLRYFENATNHEDPYFLGTFIVYSSEANSVNVMDGQQRWTTLTALMGAIYHLFDNGADEDWTEVKEEITNTFLRNEDDMPYLLSKVPHDNTVIELLSSFHGNESFDSLSEEVSEGSGNFSRMSNGVLKKYKGRNLACVGEYFIDRLKDEFELVNAQSSRRRLLNFFNIIKSRVLVNLTFTDTARVAFKMFITANARGTPLNNFDILRGLVLARNQILTGEDVNLTFDRLFTTATSEIDAYLGQSDSQKNKKIDKLISDSLSIYSGERVSKSGCLGVLEQKINDILTQGDLLAFVRYFVNYLRRWRQISAMSFLHDGMLEHSRIAYTQSQTPQHTVIYTAALIAEWGDDHLEKLLQIIQCFVMRSILVGSESPKEWYTCVPIFGHRIMNPGGRSRDQILTELAERFEHSQYNPSDDELTSTLETRQFPLKSVSQKNILVALFHAMEWQDSFLTRGGQHNKVLQLMPEWSWQTQNYYTYDNEVMNIGKYSSRLGNIFFLRGTIQDLESIHGGPASLRMGEFIHRAAGIDTSLDYLDDDEWGYTEINNRTDELTMSIISLFPHNCVID